MKSFPSVVRPVLTVVASLVLASGAVAQQKPTPPAPQAAPTIKLTPEQQRQLEARRKARVYAKDLEGLWLNSRYVAALEASRMPLQAAKKAAPVAVNVSKEGPSYPMLRTNFDKASLLRIIDIQPEKEQGSFRVALTEDDRGAVSADEVKYVSFRGRKNDAGRFETLMNRRAPVREKAVSGIQACGDGRRAACQRHSHCRTLHRREGRTVRVPRRKARPVFPAIRLRTKSG